MNIMNPELYHSLTLCATMLSLIGAMHWYTCIVRPLGFLEGNAHKARYDNPLTQQLATLLTGEFDHKPLVYVSIIHTFIAMLQITLHSIFESNIWTTAIISVSAFIAYFSIIHQRLIVYRSILTDAEALSSSLSIPHHISGFTMNEALAIIGQYPSISAKRWLDVLLNRLPAEKITQLIKHLYPAPDDKTASSLIDRLLERYPKETPLSLLQNYDLPEGFNRILLSKIS